MCLRMFSTLDAIIISISTHVSEPRGRSIVQVTLRVLREIDGLVRKQGYYRTGDEIFPKIGKSQIQKQENSLLAKRIVQKN